jgi:hypothetical protein
MQAFMIYCQLVGAFCLGVFILNYLYTTDAHVFTAHIYMVPKVAFERQKVLLRIPKAQNSSSQHRNAD